MAVPSANLVKGWPALAAHWVNAIPVTEFAKNSILMEKPLHFGVDVNMLLTHAPKSATAKITIATIELIMVSPTAAAPAA